MSVTPGRTNKPARPCLHCPECNQMALVRTSRAITPTYRVAYYACANEECGARWKADQAITHFIRRGRRPNPQVSLPMLPAVRARPG